MQDGKSKIMLNKLVDIFAHNVKEERIKRNLSQEKLAELAGLHRTYIGMIERSEKNVTLSSVEKIATALNVSPVELLEYTE